MARNLFPRLQQTFVGRKIAWRAQRMSRGRLLRGALSAWSFLILSGAPLKEVMFCLYNNETPHRNQQIFLCIRMILEQRLTNAGTNLWHYIKGWWPWKKYWPSEKWYNFIKGRVSKRNSYHPLYAKFLLSPLFSRDQQARKSSLVRNYPKSSENSRTLSEIIQRVRKQ